MTRNAFRTPPDKVDMAAEERAIRRANMLAMALTLAAFAAAYALGPAIAAPPASLPERLAFAVACWSVVAFVVLVAVLMVSITRRFSPEDIGGQAAGPPSDRLAIRAAFLQNTLEQAVVAAGAYGALTVTATGAWLMLMPAAVVLFIIGRGLFYAGYHRGAGGRAPGMALSMLPAVVIYLVAFGLWVAPS